MTIYMSHFVKIYILRNTKFASLRKEGARVVIAQACGIGTSKLEDGFSDDGSLFRPVQAHMTLIIFLGWRELSCSFSGLVSSSRVPSETTAVYPENEIC